MKTITASFGIRLISALLTLLGCGADRDLDAWNREKLAQDLAKYQAVEGTYVGTMRAQSDDSLLGALHIELLAQTRVGSGETAKAQQKPVLITRVTYEAGQTLVILSDESYYEPTTGRYQASILISPGSNEPGSLAPAEITLSGVIQKEIFKGTLEAVGYPQTGARFELKKDGEISPEIQSRIRETAKDSSNSEMEVLARWWGTTQFNRGNTRSVEALILKPTQSAEADFLNLLYPIRQVHFSLNYGGSATLLFENAKWDQRNQTLTGSAKITLGTERRFTLHCTRRSTSSAGSPEPSWECQHSTHEEGLVGTTRFHTDAGDRPQIPAPPPVLDRLESFQGTLIQQNLTQRFATLQILYPRKAESEVILELFFPARVEPVQTTLNIDGALQLIFKDSRYDLNALRLSGETELVRDSGTDASASPGQERLALSLDCDQLAPLPKDHWSCRLISSSVGTVSQVIFEPVEVLPPPPPHPPSIPPSSDLRRIAHGQATLANHTTLPASLTALLPARSISDEILREFFPVVEERLQVSLQIGPHVNAVFDSSRWTLTNGNLFGETSFIRNGEFFHLQLRCRGFYLKTVDPFQCTYRSNRLNGEVQLELH